MHKVVTARSVGASKSFDGFKIPKAQEGQHFIRAAKLTDVEFAKKRTKVEAFGF
jgi:hypothetical protein